MKVQAGEKHYTTTIWIITKEEPKKVLLLHHKKFNMWVQPGGHIEPNENPIQAAIREVKEETQINIEPYIQKGENFFETTLLPSPLLFLEEPIPAYKDTPAHFHLDFIYKIEIPYQQAIHTKIESHDIGWFTYDESLSLNLFESTRFMMKKLLHR